MNTLIRIILWATLLLAGTSVARAQIEDDLYAPAMTAKEREQHKAAIAQQKQARRQAQADALRDQQLALRAQQVYHEQIIAENAAKHQNLLVETLDEALYRRMDAMNFAPNENSNLMEIQEDYARRLQRQYNPDLYNIIIINDKMWVEPKYITSIFNGNSDASTSVNDYLKKLEKRSFGKNSSIKTYYSSDYQYWNVGHYGMQYPMSYYYGYPAGGWYPHGNYWGMYGNWGMYGGGYWGFQWGSPWYNPWYGGSWYNPWYGPMYTPYYNPWYRPIVVNRHPVVYGNTINGNNGIIRHNYPQSTRQFSGGSSSNSVGGRAAYDAGFGRGQGSYNQPQRPIAPQNQQPQRQTYEPQRPVTSPSPGTGGGGYGGGFQDTGGGRRR